MKIDPGTLGARLARENETLKRAVRVDYNGRRRIEEAIRRHAEGECDCRDFGVCMIKLYRLIPMAPRPTFRERLKRVRQGS